MGIVVVPSFGADPVTVTGPTLDSKVDGLATEFNGHIDENNLDPAISIPYANLNLTGLVRNDDVKSDAAIVSTKLNLSTISQVIAMSGSIFKLAKGADVSSVAGNIVLGEDGNYFDITGTNAITSITAKDSGTIVVLQFDSTASLVNGSNLKLNATFSGAALTQIALISDGTNWIEICRSVGQSTFATVAEVKTGTEVAKTIAPSTMIGHQGVCKGWINFNGTGTIAINDSFNVASITDNGTGDYTVTWTTSFATAYYAVSINASGSLAQNITSQAAGSVRFTLFNASSGNPADSANISVMAIGNR